MSLSGGGGKGGGEWGGGAAFLIVSVFFSFFFSERVLWSVLNGAVGTRGASFGGCGGLGVARRRVGRGGNDLCATAATGHSLSGVRSGVRER